MKGCLSNIVKLIILTLAVIGFFAIGGGDFLKMNFKNFHPFKKSQETLIDKANKIADFSGINSEEYEISKTANVMGYKAVIAEHKASGQRFIVLVPGDEVLLKKTDFSDGSIDSKIQGLTKKLEKQFIHLDDVKVLKKSTMYGIGQNIPYAKFEANPANMPTVKKVTGIIGVFEKDGKSDIILAVNTDGKYSQIISDQFFKDIK